MRGSPAPVGRGSPDPHGRARAVCLVCELRSALPCRRRHRKGIEPSGRRCKYVPHSVRNRGENGLRGRRDLAGQEDRRAAQRRDQRDNDGVLRQARAVARRAVRPSALARNRPPGNLPGEDRARRAGDPRVDRTRVVASLRDAQVFGVPDREAQNPSGRDRRRVHWPRDGGKPRASRFRRDHRRNARSGPRAAGSGNGAHCRGLPGEAWHPSGAQ